LSCQSGDAGTRIARECCQVETGNFTVHDNLTAVHNKRANLGEESDGELAWTDVEPKAGVVTCDIGDMLMRWSDDQFLSALHWIRMPAEHEYLGPRYSLPFFCQANKDAIIQGPGGKYEPIAAHDHLQQRIAAKW